MAWPESGRKFISASVRKDCSREKTVFRRKGLEIKARSLPGERCQGRSPGFRRCSLNSLLLLAKPQVRIVSRHRAWVEGGLFLGVPERQSAFSLTLWAGVMSGRRDSWTEMRTRSYIGKANFQSAATTSNISLTQEWVITAVQAPPNESYGGVL